MYKLDYYLKNELSYSFLIRGLEGYDPFSSLGKSFFVLKVSKEKELFRVIKAMKALMVLSKGFQPALRLISKRRSCWEIMVRLDPLIWLDFFFFHLLFVLKEKGLRMRSFLATEGWFFLLREIGELRWKGLFYDYYQWSSMWQVVVPLSIPEESRKFFLSSLKISYETFN